MFFEIDDLKFSEISQENTYMYVFSSRICEIFKNLFFLQNNSGGCFCNYYHFYLKLDFHLPKTTVLFASKTTL